MGLVFLIQIYLIPSFLTNITFDEIWSFKFIRILPESNNQLYFVNPSVILCCHKCCGHESCLGFLLWGQRGILWSLHAGMTGDCLLLHAGKMGNCLVASRRDDGGLFGRFMQGRWGTVWSLHTYVCWGCWSSFSFVELFPSTPLLLIRLKH